MLIKNARRQGFSNSQCFGYKKLVKINKITNANGLVTTTVLNTKISEVEIKIPDISGLVKKKDYNAKISDIEKKIFYYF